MKKALPILLSAAALAAGIGWCVKYTRNTGGTVQETGTPPPAARQEQPVPAAGVNETPPSRIVSDGPAIFKKAFWREPSADDQIANAERREWSDAEGVTRWEWFIEVNASPDLLKYLREDNPFGLRRTSPAPLPEGPPAWFTFAPEEVDVLKSGTGRLQMIFSKHNNKILATSSGNGF
ncbi:MAG: hypothetical protein EOP86_12490, partial [Verrucomicrobiaceae bacterium]